MDTVANVRIHGTTHEQPVVRWKDEHLKHFNLTPFESVERYSRKVPADALVSYPTNRYSVSYRYVGQECDTRHAHRYWLTQLVDFHGLKI
ncbi:Mu transposase domain-containing protein [Alicyclobacillus tolerans]